MITGATRVAGVIGDPVRHSLSPRLHNAAYNALGLDWVFAAFEVRDGGAAGALAGARALGFVGLSVTMPHKTAIAGLCDDLSPDAAALRSVNTVTLGRRRARRRATPPTARGSSGRCTTRTSIPAGWSVLVLGGGGAARAVTRALAGAGPGSRWPPAARRPRARPRRSRRARRSPGTTGPTPSPARR